MMRKRRKLTQEELREQFDAQWHLLEKSCWDYDHGDRMEVRRIAVVLRVLLQDRGRSRSLLSQVGKKDLLFFDTAQDRRPENLVPTFGLVVAPIDDRLEYSAPLDMPVGRPSWLVPFKYWWKKPVICIPGEFELTREDLVLTVANQDGGAHVDPEIEERYYRITREGLGAFIVNVNGEEKRFRNVEGASVRQLADEVRTTLVVDLRMIPPGLPKDLNEEDWKAQFGDNWRTRIQQPDVRVRNLCACNSGREYSACHMHGGRSEGKIVAPRMEPYTVIKHGRHSDD